MKIYLIAQRNTQTGKFELWDTEIDKLNRKPCEYSDENKAISDYESAILRYGKNNLILLNDVIVDVVVKAKIWTPEV